MDCAVMERRADERADDPWRGAARATVRPGCPIRIVNISRGGALVDTTRPLRPGARVQIQVATSTSTFGMSARVLRCVVRALSPGNGVVYRGALRFDERLSVLGK